MTKAIQWFWLYLIHCLIRSTICHSIKISYLKNRKIPLEFFISFANVFNFILYRFILGWSSGSTLSQRRCILYCTCAFDFNIYILKRIFSSVAKHKNFRQFLITSSSFSHFSCLSDNHVNLFTGNTPNLTWQLPGVSYRIQCIYVAYTPLILYKSQLLGGANQLDFPGVYSSENNIHMFHTFSHENNFT